MKSFFEKKQSDFIKSHGTTYLINCGSLENLHKTANFLPIFSDGLCLQYKYVHAPNASFNCKYLLSQVLLSGVRLGCVLRPNMIGHVINTPQLEADIDPISLTTNLSVQYYPISPLRLSLSAQLFPKLKTENGITKDKWNKITLSANYYARNSTVTISLHECSRLVATFLTSFSSRIAFGFELLSDWKCLNGLTPFLDVLIPSVGGRYFLEDKCYAATLGPVGLDFTFWRLVNNDNQFGCSFLYNINQGCCLGNIYYQRLYDDKCIRGCINSNGAIGGTLSSPFKDFGGCNVEISLLQCIPTRKFSFGLKIEFDSSSRIYA